MRDSRHAVLPYAISVAAGVLAVLVTAALASAGPGSLWVGTIAGLCGLAVGTAAVVRLGGRSPEHGEQRRAVLGLAGCTGALCGLLVADPMLPARDGTDALVSLLVGHSVAGAALALPFLVPSRARLSGAEGAPGAAAGGGSASLLVSIPVAACAAGLPVALLREGGPLAGRLTVPWSAALLGAAALACGVAALLTASRGRRGANASVWGVWPVMGLLTASISAAGTAVLTTAGRPGGPLVLALVPFALAAVAAVGRVSRETATSVSERLAVREEGERALAINEERRRATQLQILNRLALVLNSEQDADRMLDQVLRGATQLLGARSGSLYLVHNGGLQLEAFSIVRGGTGTDPRYPGVGAKELAQSAVAQKRVIRVGAAPDDSISSVDGLLAAPLVKADGEALGCFVIAGKPSVGGFTTADEMMASTLAAHVTVALQNRRRLEQEQRVAEYLQRAILPEVTPLEGLEVDITYQSASEAALVGGDFYDIMPLDATRTCLTVGDVCGKGLPAATQMAMMRYTIRAFASLGLRVGRWLTLCNEAGTESGEAPGYITVALVVADVSTHTLDYALAGHPPPVVALPDSSWELAGRPGLPIGVFSNQQYEGHRVVLPKGATLVLYTDGLFEAHPPGGALFGEVGLSAAVRAVAGEPLAGAAARLVEAARAHAGGLLADDVVVMVVRFRGSNGEPVG